MISLLKVPDLRIFGIKTKNPRSNLFRLFNRFKKLLEMHDIHSEFRIYFDEIVIFILIDKMDLNFLNFKLKVKAVTIFSRTL